MDETGHAVAIWKRYGILSFGVEESHSSDYGATWSTASLLSLVAGQIAGGPQVTMDETGHAVAVWSGWDGSNYIVQAADTGQDGIGDIDADGDGGGG
jgi:hypothetical protein